MPIDAWPLFALAILIASVSPGPNVFIVMVHALRHGWRASLFTIGGNIACLLLIAMLAALGVGALIQAQPVLYFALKMLGAGYLIWMGASILWRSLQRQEGAGIAGLDDVVIADAPPNRLKLAGEAFLVSASNPKSVIFLSAVFPQFLDPTKALAPQFAVMFVTIIIIVTTIHVSYAAGASALRHRIAQPRVRLWLSRLTGGTFLAFGAGVLASR